MLDAKLFGEFMQKTFNAKTPRRKGAGQKWFYGRKHRLRISFNASFASVNQKQLLAAYRGSDFVLSTLRLGLFAPLR
jgi:hypothetical protein